MIQAERREHRFIWTWLVAIPALAALSTPAFAQEKSRQETAKQETTKQETANKAKPRIEVEPRSLYVGEVFVGEKGKGEIKVMNTGTAVLKIYRVQSSCGCTVAGLKSEDKEIQPGGSITLPVTMKPSKVKQGDKFVKTVTIHSNDPIQPALPVRVEARVKLGVDSIPYSLVFKKMQFGEVRTQELKLKSYTDEEFKITRIDGVSGPLMVDFDEDRIAKEHVIKVTVGPLADFRNMHRRLVARTTHSKTPKVDIPVLVEVEKLVTVSPSYLNLGRHEAGSTVKKRITFTTKDDKPVESVQVRATRYPVEVKAEPIEGAVNQWTLTFKVPEDMPGSKLISPLEMTTNIEKAGPVRLTFSLTVNKPPKAPTTQDSNSEK
jgi:hypothetical protein